MKPRLLLLIAVLGLKISTPFCEATMYVTDLAPGADRTGLPRQSDLDELLTNITVAKVRVKYHRDFPSFSGKTATVTEPKALAELAAALAIVSPHPLQIIGACECGGSTELVLTDSRGKSLTLEIRNQDFLCWNKGAWKSDAFLRSPTAFDTWLLRHAVTPTSEEAYGMYERNRITELVRKQLSLELMQFLKADDEEAKASSVHAPAGSPGLDRKLDEYGTQIARILFLNERDVVKDSEVRKNLRLASLSMNRILKKRGRAFIEKIHDDSVAMAGLWEPLNASINGDPISQFDPNYGQLKDAPKQPIPPGQLEWLRASAMARLRVSTSGNLEQILDAFANDGVARKSILQSLSEEKIPCRINHDTGVQPHGADHTMKVRASIYACVLLAEEFPDQTSTDILSRLRKSLHSDKVAPPNPCEETMLAIAAMLTGDTQILRTDGFLYGNSVARFMLRAYERRNDAFAISTLIAALNNFGYDTDLGYELRDIQKSAITMLDGALSQSEDGKAIKELESEDAQREALLKWWKLHGKTHCETLIKKASAGHPG